MEDMEAEAAMERKVQVMIDRYHLSKKTVKLYREVFDMLDLDGDEDLTLVELKIGLNAAGLKPTDLELNAVMAAVDPDGSGMVDYAEFVQFLAEVQMDSGEGIMGATSDRMQLVGRFREDQQLLQAAAAFEAAHRPANALTVLPF